eukprot:Colp12_sorted_trinity150504_noHs@17137
MSVAKPISFEIEVVSQRTDNIDRFNRKKLDALRERHANTNEGNKADIISAKLRAAEERRLRTLQEKIAKAKHFTDQIAASMLKALELQDAHKQKVEEHIDMELAKAKALRKPKSDALKKQVSFHAEVMTIEV